MREIKFRFWQPVNKKVKDDWQLLTHKEHGIQTINQVLNGTIVKTIIMQYTGLKDKNGKEIYEGDIVRFCLHLYIVKFIEGSFVIECSLDENLQHLRGKTHSLEVVGNIYENPELLNEKEDKETPGSN